MTPGRTTPILRPVPQPLPALSTPLRSSSAARQPPGALWAYGLLLAGAMGAMVLAGFAPQGNLAVFLVCAGGALMFCAPAVPVAGRWWLGGAALVGCAASALLPARLLPFTPAWRRALAALPEVPLPGTITPAPQETLFWLALLAFTVVLGLFLLGHPLRSRALLPLALAAALLCAGYAAAAIAAKLAGWSPPLAREAGYGFFPNRNHTATLLVTGSVLALSVLAFAFQERRQFTASLALTALLPCAGPLFFFTASRAGAVFLFLGALLWLAGLGRHRDARALRVPLALLAAGIILFFVFPSPGRDRLLASLGLAAPAPAATPTPAPTPGWTPASTAAAPPPSGEGRTYIWRDAARMIADAPWTGTGLGSFAYVFPQYRTYVVGGFRALHPESDWLLFLAETGWPAFACLAALGLGLGARLRAGRAHPYWPLRWGCAAAALTALLHGAVDVPAHRAALGWWVLILAGLGLSLAAPDPAKKRRGAGDIRGGGGAAPGWQRGVFALAGAAAVALGGWLAAAQWFGAPALPPFAVEDSPFEIFARQNRQDYAGAAALARRVIARSPMYDPPYFQLGLALAAASDDEGTDARVDAVFRAQRRLDPLTPNLAFQQADAWRGYDPVRQAAMILDALARRGLTARSEGKGLDEAAYFLSVQMWNMPDQPDVQRHLLGAVRPDPRLTHAWVISARGEIVREQAPRLAADAAFLAALPEADLRQRREDWFTRPEREQPASFLPGGQGAAVEGWPVRLRQRVNAGNYRGATEELARRYGLSLEPTADAPEPGSPETLLREAAQAARGGDWPGAWERLERYVQRTRQTEWP